MSGQVASTVSMMLCLFAAASAAGNRRANRDLVERLSRAGATSSATAIPLEDDLSRRARRGLRHLIRRGAIGEARNGRYYLDTEGWESFQSRTRITARIAVVVFALFLLAALWL